VTIVEDEGSLQTILEIEVRGKRGVGYCKSMTGAVRRSKGSKPGSVLRAHTERREGEEQREP